MECLAGTAILLPMAGSAEQVSEPWRQAANYADRLLRGAKVAELPFVQPSRVVFGVNLKTARLIEATIPFDLLALADEVME
jgi:putative tryptophan/tyrosine transport system substrate-binding protein